MAKLPKALAAYAQASGAARPRSDVRYFSYRGKNLMGVAVDDIFSAKDEDDLREKLAKQFIAVEEIREISQSEYQERFEKKRNHIVDSSQRLIHEKEAQRQRELDEGTVDPDEEVENFIDRFKKFTRENEK